MTIFKKAMFWATSYILWYSGFSIMYYILHTPFEIIVLSGMAVIIANTKENN